MNATLTPEYSPQRLHPSLTEQLDGLIRTSGMFECAIPGLRLMRTEAPTPRVPIIYEPSIYVVAQGAKKAYLGDEVYTYDALNYLVLPVPMPLEAHVTQASPEHPYLALRLNLDLALLGELLLEMEEKVTASPGSRSRGLFISAMETDLSDAISRLLGTLHDESKRTVLAPMLLKEILFYLLQGPQGWQLRLFAQSNHQHYRIAQVMSHIQRHYLEPLEINQLATLANMSVSSLHHHFKGVTGVSPLQYIKTARLHQARRLMLHDRLAAADAAFKVGYTSPSQFSREYKRLFGLSPKADHLHT